MSNFSLFILGSSSAVPAHGRHPSAQILRHYNTDFLIDCGEGTQFQMNRFHIKRANLNYILISHMHGDHYFGLVGLLNSLSLNGRKNDLHIYGPPDLEQIILLQANYLDEHWPFKLIFHAMSFGESYLLFETIDLEVYTLPLEHKIPCNGFLFKEKAKPRSMKVKVVKEYQIPYNVISDIKGGADLLQEDGTVVKNGVLTNDPPPSLAYAYCSDTMYNENLLPLIKDVDLLYHEATFLAEDEEKARLRFHSTTKEAASIAKQAGAKQLLIGHFSAKYKDLDPYLDEAKEVFPNAELAIEGREYLIE